MNKFKFHNEALKRNQKEFRLQVCVVEQIPGWFPGLMFLHIPNRPGNATDGFFKQKMGAKKGASDLVFTWRTIDRVLHCGLIELKADDGKLSNDQNRFLSAFHQLGWETAVCQSAKQVFDALCKWKLQPACWGIREPDYTSASEKQQIIHDMYAPR